MLETLDKIASILSGFGIFIGAIFVTLQFKYKHDAEVRKLYLSNYEQINSVLIELSRKAHASDEMLTTLWQTLNEAELYLHRDIVKFIKKFKSKYTRLFSIKIKLESLPVGDARNKLCDEQMNLILNLIDTLEELKKSYRKQLIHDPWGNFLDWLKQFKKQ